MTTHHETLAASAAILENLTAQMSGIAHQARTYQQVLRRDGTCSTDDMHLCRLLAIGTADGATSHQKSAAGLARMLLSARVAENGASIYCYVDLYQDACLEEAPAMVRAVVKAYRQASMSNRKPELVGDLPSRIEAELIRDWFLRDEALNDQRLALPDVVCKMAQEESDAAKWVAFGGPFDFQTLSGSPTSVAGCYKRGVHLESQHCQELLLKLFAALL